MILPRSPSPPPPLEERLIDSLTVEEMGELLLHHRVGHNCLSGDNKFGFSIHDAY